MRPYVSVLTLAVADLDRAVQFYRDGLGLPTDGIVGQGFEHGAVAFFDLAGGLKLALWAQVDLGHDTGLVQQPVSTTAVSAGHNMMSRADVDLIMQDAAEAGAKIIKSPQQTFYGGYAGYFTELDGHLWEIVCNPQMMHNA
jgi:uncharacterized protein